MVKPKEDLKKAVLLMRFHTHNPSKTSPVYQTMASIARALDVPYNRVRHICNYTIAPLAKQHRRDAILGK